MAEGEFAKKRGARADRDVLDTGTPCQADSPLTDGPHPAPKFVPDQRALLAAEDKSAAEDEPYRLGSGGRRWMSAATACLLIAISTVGVQPRPVSAAPQQVRWVALGDSYSAGVGLGPVGPDKCDRDDGAYAQVAKNALVSSGQLSVAGFANLACMGAVMADYGNSQYPNDGVYPQRNAIKSDTNLATMTFGGNDIGFKGKIAGCMFGDCGADTYELSPRSAANPTLTWDLLYSSLLSMYLDARGLMAPSGHLFVLSYPSAFTLTNSDCNGFSPSEQVAMNALDTRLGDTIYAATQEANCQKGNVHFVDWRSGPRLENHYQIPYGKGYAGEGQTFPAYIPADGLCNSSKPPQLNGFIPLLFAEDINGYSDNSFHPTSYGYQFAAGILRSAVAQAFPATPDPPPSAYAGHIVQWDGDTNAQKTSWVVSGDLKRYWIPDTGTFNCLKGMGYPGPHNLWSGILNQLPDMSGQGATCGGDWLGTNRVMLRNTYIRSNDGRYILRLQGDGNLVMYGPQGVVWANHRTSDYLIMQPDGNLVTYAYGRGATWWSGTSGSGANTLVVQNDGNLIIYAPGRAVWTYAAGVLPLPLPSIVDPGWALQSGTWATDVAFAQIAGGWEMFQIGSGGVIYRKKPGTNWTAINGPRAKRIAVATSPDGRAELFYIGMNDQLYHHWESSPGGDISGWEGLGGYVREIAAARAGGLWEIFAVGGDNAIYRATQANHVWQRMNGTWAYAVAAATSRDGRVELFHIASGRNVMHAWQSSPGSGFGSWVDIGGWVTAIGASSVGNGEYELYAIGGGNTIWRNAPWSGIGGFQQLAGGATRIAAARNPDGRTEVLVVGGGNQLFHAWQKRVGWF